MQFIADPFAAKQHDSQKSCFEEKCRQHLIGHERAKDRSGLVRKHRPVGPELIRHHNARHDAHAKSDGKDFLPVVEQGQVGVVMRTQSKGVQHSKIAGQPD